jgi:hypothetical protein
LSSISVSSASRQSRSRFARRLAIGLLGVSAAAVALVAFLRLGRRAENPAAVPAPSAEAPVSASIAEVSASAPAPAPPIGPAEVVSAPSSHPARTAAPPKARPCRIKSYLDESGIKHFVKECK